MEWDKKKLYIQQSGQYCPVCDSPNIQDKSAMEYVDDTHQQTVECTDCKAVWREIYEMVDIQIEE